MEATPGRVVHYRLSEGDVEAIRANRLRAGITSAQSNEVYAGDTYPAMVVRTWGGPAANLKVELDGYDTYWATSRVEGDQPGTWTWPPRV